MTGIDSLVRLFMQRQKDALKDYEAKIMNRKDGHRIVDDWNRLLDQRR